MAEREVNEDVNDEGMNNNEKLETNSCSILAGLNLVLILSSLSSSDEQRLNFEEIEERESGNWNLKGKYSGSRSNFPTRRQQVSGFNRAVERQQMSKVQTKMKDCR